MYNFMYNNHTYDVKSLRWAKKDPTPIVRSRASLAMIAARVTVLVWVSCANYIRLSAWSGMVLRLSLAGVNPTKDAD